MGIPYRKKKVSSHVTKRRKEIWVNLNVRVSYKKLEYLAEHL